MKKQDFKVEAQWPIGYGVGLRIKRSSVRIRPWPLCWVLGTRLFTPIVPRRSLHISFYWLSGHPCKIYEVPRKGPVPYSGPRPYSGPQRDFFAPFLDHYFTTQWSTITRPSPIAVHAPITVHGTWNEKTSDFFIWIFSFFFSRTKGSKMKKRTKEEAIEKDPVVYPDVWLSVRLRGD